MAHDLPDGAFEGREAFLAHLHAAFDAAAAEGWREIVLSDPDFSDWPLGDQRVVDALQAWAAPGRSMRLMAQRFDVLERRHARFVHWRRIWDHLIQPRACSGPHAADVPSALWTPGWYLHRIDSRLGRGICGATASDRVALRQLLDERFQMGRPAFAASVLGL